MRIGGICSTDELDQQDERVIQAGLDFSPFLDKGWYNDNHGAKTTDVLGYPTAAKLVQKGEMLPNGRSAKKRGWWTEGHLLNTKEGRKLWGLTQALAKTDRKLGFSIEGSVRKRDAMNPNVISRAVVKNVAITHCPVNTGTEMHALAKALTAGGDVVNPGASPGQGFPLRTESLDPTLSDEENDGGDGDAETVKDTKGHPVEGGLYAPDHDHDAVIKAEVDETFSLEPVTEVGLMHEWADTVSAAVQQTTRPSRLTKAEARIIVASRHPQLSAAQVDLIVETARSPRP
ncbi:MAG: hypothetical protein CMB99_01440 [Flavobacteriaceae bacterium]|nr:hypothetical protein [Flavobacteriaceae bacterium]